MVKEQAELAVYWKKMSSFSRVGDLHSHSCGDPCERLWSAAASELGHQQTGYGASDRENEVFMKAFWVLTGGCLLSLREIWSKRRGCTEKDPVIALLGCCRRLSFALKTPTSPQIVRRCKRVESVKMKSIKKCFFSWSVIFLNSCSYL